MKAIIYINEKASVSLCKQIKQKTRVNVQGRGKRALESLTRGLETSKECQLISEWFRENYVEGMELEDEGLEYSHLKARSVVKGYRGGRQ